MIISIDFDGTIVNHEYPFIGKIKENAKKVINNLCDKGHTIIIWTCRYEKEDLINMKNFLGLNEIRYHYINENAKGINFKPYPKIYADIYIDDRNIFCEKINWFDVERYFLQKKVL